MASQSNGSDAPVSVAAVVPAPVRASTAGSGPVRLDITSTVLVPLERRLERTGVELRIEALERRAVMVPASARRGTVSARAERRLQSPRSPCWYQAYGVEGGLPQAPAHPHDQ
jgi:hypothetical protein